MFVTVLLLHHILTDPVMICATFVIIPCLYRVILSKVYLSTVLLPIIIRLSCAPVPKQHTEPDSQTLWYKHPPHLYT